MICKNAKMLISRHREGDVFTLRCEWQGEPDAILEVSPLLKDDPVLQLVIDEFHLIHTGYNWENGTLEYKRREYV
jgi:hypothetical protein